MWAGGAAILAPRQQKPALAIPSWRHQALKGQSASAKHSWSPPLAPWTAPLPGGQTGGRQRGTGRHSCPGAQLTGTRLQLCPATRHRTSCQPISTHQPSSLGTGKACLAGIRALARGAAACVQRPLKGAVEGGGVAGAGEGGAGAGPAVAGAVPCTPAPGRLPAPLVHAPALAPVALPLHTGPAFVGDSKRNPERLTGL